MSAEAPRPKIKDELAQHALDDWIDKALVAAGLDAADAQVKDVLAEARREGVEHVNIPEDLEEFLAESAVKLTVSRTAEARAAADHPLVAETVYWDDGARLIVYWQELARRQQRLQDLGYPLKPQALMLMAIAHECYHIYQHKRSAEGMAAEGTAAERTAPTAQLADPVDPTARSTHRGQEPDALLELAADVFSAYYCKIAYLPQVLWEFSRAQN